MTGSGLQGVNATGIAIGGTPGHAVTVAGGMGVSGTVTASAVEGNAVGIRLGAGASVPVVNISGSVGASGGGTATTGVQAILVETGANVATIKNSGSILAVRAGTEGTATAILDQSGTLDLVENSGSTRSTTSRLWATRRSPRPAVQPRCATGRQSLLRRPAGPQIRATSVRRRVPIRSRFAPARSRQGRFRGGADL